MTVLLTVIGTANPNSATGGELGQRFYDATHNVDYLCTTAGNAATAVWTRLSESVGTQKMWSPTAAGTNTPPTGWAICDGSTVNGIVTPNYIGMQILGGQPTGHGATPNANGFGANTIDTDVGATSHSHGLNQIPVGYISYTPGSNGYNPYATSETSTGGTTYLPSSHTTVVIMRVY